MSKSLELTKECCEFFKSCQNQGVGFCIKNAQKINFYNYIYAMLKSEKCKEVIVDNLNTTIEELYNYCESSGCFEIKISDLLSVMNKMNKSKQTD